MQYIYHQKRRTTVNNEVEDMELIQKTRAANDLLSPQETAELLGTTPGVLSVWRTTRCYPLRYITVGPSVRYRLEDVQAFIESRTISPVEV